MSPFQILTLIAVYFSVLLAIGHFTADKTTNTETFFNANKKSPWYLVAFGMIGTSLSGVTFISVPGQVLSNGFSYFQIVIGYLLGYLIIGTILMPMYYRLNLVSIYGYLEQRLGFYSYKTGAFYFLLSRSLGSSARFYLAIGVLQLAVFEKLGVPFWLTVSVAILLIWLYTYRGGIKTIIYTDTLQSLFMLLSVGSSIYIVASELDVSVPQLFQKVYDSSYSTVFFWDFESKDYFWKQFFSGAFIAVVMTGLDQDLMQKNLSCKNIGEAQKNMFWFSITMVIMNALFLTLGAALYLYAAANNIALPVKTDDVYPVLALNYFSPIAGAIFMVGIIAATYASTDSALTALTTSFCIDFLNISKFSENEQNSLRHKVHIGFSVLMVVLVLLIKQVNNSALIATIFKMAGYTYGPLLGLYTFGLFTKWQVKDKWVPVVCLSSPIISLLLNTYSVELFNGYEFGFEILLVNGLITFLGLLASIKAEK